MLRLVFFLAVSCAARLGRGLGGQPPGHGRGPVARPGADLERRHRDRGPVRLRRPGRHPVRAPARDRGPARQLARLARPPHPGARLRGADPRPDGGRRRRPQRGAHLSSPGRAPPARQWQPAAAPGPDGPARGQGGGRAPQVPADARPARRRVRRPARPAGPGHEDRRLRRGPDPGAPRLPPQPDHAMGADHPVRAPGPRRQVGRGAAAGRRDAGAGPARRRRRPSTRRACSTTCWPAACATRTGPPTR